MKQENLIVGISGASGAPIAIGLLKALRALKNVKTHLIITEGASQTILLETKNTVKEVMSYADYVYDTYDYTALLASGTYQTMGMVVVPCSMKTLAGIACAYSDSLLLRAADVTLKERRKLVLCVRECPLHEIHLSHMLTLTRMGAVILPPMLSYYNHPKTIGDATEHIVGKLMDSFGLTYSNYRRWETEKEKKSE